MNVIYIGADKDGGTYRDGDMYDISCTLSVAVVADKLAIDELSVTIDFIPVENGSLITSNELLFVTADEMTIEVVNGGSFDFDSYGMNLTELPAGTPVWYYSGDDGDELIGKFYFSKITRVGRSSYQLEAVSAIGILAGQMCVGGMYDGDTVSDIAADIIGDSVSYTIDSALAQVPVFGWLPYASKRDNLHQLLLCIGADIKKDVDGDMVLYWNNGNTVKQIPDGRVFIGGSVAYGQPMTRVEVTEHTYHESEESELLFDNSADSQDADGVTVFFSNPHHDLTVTGTLEVSDSGVNYAVVSGKGTLIGKKYDHQTKIISVQNEDSDSADKVYSVTDCTLISNYNSGNVAKRLLDYYTNSVTASADIVMQGEKPGDQVIFTDAFGDQQQAFISSMILLSRGFVRASCDMIFGYIPSWQGNTFNSSTVLTGAGTYTVPAGSHFLTLIIIGGGNGGDGGSDGGEVEVLPKIQGYEYLYYYNGYNIRQFGGHNTYTQKAKGGAGGLGGNGGSAGKIYQVTIEVEPGDAFSYSCGAGGIGGAAGSSGGSGENSTFGDYTSSDGEVQEDGISDRFTGIRYATRGVSGVSGGQGGGFLMEWNSENDPQDVVFGGETYHAGSKGTVTLSHKVGDYAYQTESKTAPNGTNVSFTSTRVFVGSGGGAAVGGNGGNGGNVTSYTLSGNGGNGGNASAPSPVTRYGCGGNGGHGGGGAGAAGDYYDASAVYMPLFGTHGTPGSGSAGSDGAPGCIIVYH